jgi:serine protease Do
MVRWGIVTAGVLLLVGSLAAQNPREEKVRNDKKRVEAGGYWIYNDIAAGFAEAKKSGKPMVVVLRCLPCEECVKLDDEAVDSDQRVKPLLDQFVRVRAVMTNGLDLNLFQYDYDQSWAVMLLNADGTIYGRYGTRSHRTHWSDDVSVDGLARALQGALDLHAGYPKNKDSLANKRGTPPEFPTPEKYPQLKDRFTATLNYEGNVVASCIHCHQIGDAQRAMFPTRRQQMPESMIFQYPHPRSLGLVLDPRESATVVRAEKDTLAAKAGFQAGDVIVSLEGQPLVSIADVQWVLHNAPAEATTLKAVVRRAGKEVPVALALPKGWRQLDDIGWRASTWGLRRMATGGMLLKSLTPEERTKAELGDKAMGLRVEHVGQFGPHAAAMKAGVRKGDIVTAFDGRSDLAREADVIFHALQKRNPGDMVDVTVLREGKTVTMKLPIQP